MNCGSIQELLQYYLDNTIGGLEKIIVEEHLKSCKECKRELTELKLLFWELDEIPLIDFPEEATKVKEEILKNLIEAKLSSDDKEFFRLKNLIAIQSNIINHSTLFLKFLPGTKFVIKKSKYSTTQVSFLLEDFFKSRSRKLLLRGIL